MGLYFGTDGLRGKVNDELSYDIAYRVGNSLGALRPRARVIIGRDTRSSGSMLTMAVAAGLTNAGASVTIIGVCPTAGVSFLTKELGFDFGIVISASHNPPEFNGIKIFNKYGNKVGDKIEGDIERRFLHQITCGPTEIGNCTFLPKIVDIYVDFLVKSAKRNLNGLKIVLDCANGAAYKIAPKVFKRLGAKVVTKSKTPNGNNINEGCGALHIDQLQKSVIKSNADIGFAFDGDSDRVIAVDECGNVVDGDKIIYLFAKTLHTTGKLYGNTVIGTRHTNMGVEKALNKLGISLIRTDIGDKYVSSKLEELNLNIGGEQSGHVFVKNLLPTGDGILNAVLVSGIVKERAQKLSAFFDFKLYAQANVNVRVKDKMRVINSEKLTKTIEKEEKTLDNRGRIMVRVSGTEPYIRIMVESENAAETNASAERIKNEIIKIDEGE